METSGKSQAEWEEYGGDPSLYNAYEAALVVRIVSAFCKSGSNSCMEKRIAVICPYRLQADVIKQCLIGNRVNMVEVLDLEGKPDARTVDAVQGRERDIIIFNIVATWPHRALQDYRRLNVAITRARTKLVIVGSRDVCQIELPHFHDFVKFVEKNGLVTPSPNDLGGKIDIVRSDIEKLTSRIALTGEGQMEN